MKQLLSLAILAVLSVGPTLGYAQDSNENDSRMQELSKRVEELEARLSAAEAAKAVPAEAAKAEEGAKADAGSDWQAALEERFGSLSLHGNFVGYYQGSDGATIGGQKVDGTSDAGFVANLEFGWKPLDTTEVMVQVHAGEGHGADRNLVPAGALLADLNTLDDDNSENGDDVRLLQAYLTQSFLDEQLKVSVGKTQALGFIDGNAYAGDEVTQFVGKPFVNDPVLDTENEYAPLLAVVGKPSEVLELTMLMSSSGRPNAAEEFHKDTWENIFSSPLVAGQVAVSPEFLDQKGTYRLYGWGATYDHDKLVRPEALDPATGNLVDSPARGKGWGMGLSLDQQVSEMLGLFARFGYHAKEVYAAPVTWATGASLKGLIPDRPEDTLGLGIAGLVVREGRLTSADSDGKLLGDGQELHMETYYRIAFGEHLALSPDIQYVANPLGNEDNDDVVAGMLRLEASF